MGLELKLGHGVDTVVTGSDQTPTSRSYGLERVAETGTDTNWDNWSFQKHPTRLGSLTCSYQAPDRAQ